MTPFEEALMAPGLVNLPILSVLRLAPLKLKNSPDKSGSNSFNFCASLYQERFTKWSKRDSVGSHKSLAGTWIKGESP
jgi:hypothetical protein